MTRGEEYKQQFDECLERLEVLIDESGISNTPIEYALAELKDALRPHVDALLGK